MPPGDPRGTLLGSVRAPCLRRQDAAVDHRDLEAREGRYEGERTDMKPNFIYLTFAAVLAIGAGVLGGPQDASSSEKKHSQVAATPSSRRGGEGGRDQPRRGGRGRGRGWPRRQPLGLQGQDRALALGQAVEGLPCLRHGRVPVADRHCRWLRRHRRADRVRLQPDPARGPAQRAHRAGQLWSWQRHHRGRQALRAAAVPLPRSERARRGRPAVRHGGPLRAPERTARLPWSAA